MTRKPTRKQAAEVTEAAEDPAPPARPNTPQPPAPLTSEQIDEWLLFSTPELIARRDELIDGLRKTAKAYPTIEDEDQLGNCAENIRMAKALGTAIEARREREKGPFLEGGRTVDQYFRALRGPLNTAMEPVQAAMNAYGIEVARKNREEAERVAVIAREKARREQEAAAAALEAQRNAEPAIDRAVRAEAQAEKAEALAGGTAADLTRTRGVYGAVTSLRQTWGWNLVDISLVPAAYLMINPDMVKAAAKDRDGTGKPTATIPGIEWIVTKATMGVR